MSDVLYYGSAIVFGALTGYGLWCFLKLIGDNNAK